MKKLLFIILVVFTTHNLFSQTNVFPPDGNVGVGTATPSANLHVPGDGATIGQANLNNSYLLVGSTTHGIGFDNNEIFKKGGGLYFGTGDAYSVFFRTNKLNALTIDTNQRIGIGTTTPAHKLDVAGTISSQMTIVNDKLYIGNGVSNQNQMIKLQYNVSTAWHMGIYDTSGSLFTIGDGGTNSNRFVIRKGSGNVGIGTITPDYKLDVVGTIRARELKVDMQGADFVFEDDYPLRTIEEVEEFVSVNKHLPEIAPAKEMQENGVNQSEMNQKLLQKIEELTLYVIQQQNEINGLKGENQKLKDIQLEWTELKNLILKK